MIELERRNATEIYFRGTANKEKKSKGLNKITKKTLPSRNERKRNQTHRKKGRKKIRKKKREKRPIVNLKKGTVRGGLGKNKVKKS